MVHAYNTHMNLHTMCGVYIGKDSGHDLVWNCEDEDGGFRSDIECDKCRSVIPEKAPDFGLVRINKWE